ncbi:MULTISPECIES: Stk1 family PASTA domain-containing Ser/Thr kinase [Bacillus]|uniref:Serine/threonine-protein kinase PrkC n=1 Tax=Bacillus infantis TaxID=324767 RepID=A0A5D4SIY8_9BACI|nr:MULTISPECIES: Stk1 family PASTA domain-containing Ser/Thr kinase [Bacillus]MDT0159443.1 Stk1 family PASTA domain-containing Ser/Thr kinase [Bacillus sp. AG4(2022)]PLR71386.1 serine/threonine protein kinase [Bacillus sp. UMB0728]TYS63110.1 Stk1 family PASTA domain-containing Ser/Thr kinase [Bacillus infantis]
MLIGKRISGRYKILDMIGGGGMANVYLAHDMILDRDVAVKILRLDFAENDEFIRRFHREAQSATSLAHPNIVSIYDVGEEDSIYYIVMEYVEGQTLKQYIQQHSPVPVDTALDIMKQLLSAISHAHQHHIVHRDIKPHNILVDRLGNVKITDFGIAMALSSTSITQTNSVLGSVHYLSPEQARGGMANKKSDIYSLGIVMFELLTGRLPFSGESAVSIALKHLQSETPSLRRWNPSIPQSVENIVLKATAKDPFHRYENVEDMEEDIRTALEPDRMNEKKFSVPDDDDATKAIPVITSDRPYQNMDETRVHEKDDKGSSAGPAPAAKKQKKDKKKKKKWPIVLVSLFLFFVVMGVLALTVLPELFLPKEIEVPDVAGETIEDATSILTKAGFEVEDPVEINDEEVEEGLVIKTDPKAGRMAKEESSITIYLSSGKEKFEMSDYTGRSFEEVESLLEKEGFTQITREDANNEDEPEGTILEQSIDEGEEVIPGETGIEFTVSSGPAPIVLKDLTGLNLKGVQDYAESTGLKIDTSKEEYHDTVEKGLVISQSQPAGTELGKGSGLSVTFSKGKEEIPPKTVPIEITIPYEPEEEGEPQEIQILVEDMNNKMTAPFDTFYITEERKYNMELLIQEGSKAYYKVLRNSQQIIDEEVDYPGN